jgi:signal transduction histidine kinase
MTRPMVPPVPTRPSVKLLDVALIATVAALALLTVLSVSGPQFRVLVPRADLVVNTAAVTLIAAVTVLAWARFRELNDPFGLFTAAAFLVLFAADGGTLVHLLAIQDGSSAAEPVVQAPLYVAGIAQLMVAGLLIAGMAAVLGNREVAFPFLVFVAPAAVLLTFMALARLLEPNLPELESLAAGASSTPEQQAAGELRHSTALGALLQLSLAVLFVVAAVLARGLYRRRGWASDALLIVALVFGAFSAVNAAIHSTAPPGYLTEVGLLQVAFVLLLVLGRAADARGAFRALRRTNVTLERTRGDDAATAGLEERSRLSRELHDGLAQNLWLAKLKVGRLLSLPDVGPEAIALSEELGSAIEASLAEARQAVMTLRTPEEGTFPELLGRYVDDFSDAFGLPADFSFDEDLPPLEPAVQAELMRIAQESLTNARRHSDAALIRVELGVEHDQLTLAIIDNGRGFDMATIRKGAFGLASMRERAVLVGGQLEIESGPDHGTRVSVRLPLPATRASS